MLAGFDVVVEVAFNAGFQTLAASRVWTDVTDYVESSEGIDITRGRPDQFGVVQPSKLSLTFDNKDGRFTPENTAGAYYPNVKKGRPIRVTVTYASVSYVRFTGFVDEWPVAWPEAEASYATVVVTASSRTARLGTAAELRSIVEEEILHEPSSTDYTLMYFPMGEPDGSVAAGNISKFRQDPATIVQVGSGGTVQFGTGTGPGTDGLSCPTFTRVDASNGKYLSCRLAGNFGSGEDQMLFGTAINVAIEAFITTTTAAAQTILRVVSPTGGYLLIGINAAGKAVGVTSPGGTTARTTTSAASVNDGQVHHIALQAVWASFSEHLTPTLTVDGVALSLASNLWGSELDGNPFSTYNVVELGGPQHALAGGLFNGTIAHAAILRSPETADITRHFQSGSTGFSGERSDQRIQRLARLGGISSTDVSVETGLSTSIAHDDITGKTPIAAMRDIEATEQGLLFDSRADLLTFHARSHRYNATSAFTLDVAAQEVESDLAPRLDDQNLINDVTASRPGGLTTRVTDATSTAEYGFYRQSPSLLTTSDNEVQSLADWLVNRYATPRVTIPNVWVDLLNTAAAKIPALLTADLGSRFTIAGLPASAPAATVDLFIEGTVERLTGTSYTVGFNTSPAALSNVWALDSALYSQLDSSTVLAY